MSDEEIESPVSAIDVKLGNSSLLESKKEEILATYKAASEKSFMFFIRGLIIDSQKGPRIFESVMAEFQREVFVDIAPNLQDLRDGLMPNKRRYWIERTKKASKDADLALIVAWLVAFPRRPFYGQIGAADRDQAAIVRDRLSALLFHNPWLNDYIYLTGNEIRSAKNRPDGKPLCRVDIKSSDVAGAHGGTPDLLVVNELSHIAKWEFVENLMDNADGVAQGMVIIATNAGFKGTKPFVWRTNFMNSEDWGVYILAKPAPWHSYQTVMEAKARNPRSRYLRLWRGIWVSGKGDALNEEDIEPIFVLSGPTLHPETDWIYFAGLDLGVKHDHSAVALIGANEKTGKLKLCQWKAWDPTDGKDGEVNLLEVEEYTLSLCSHFRTIGLWYDPFQAKLLAQRLARKITVREFPFSSSINLNRMASDFLQVVKSKQLECYDDKDFRVRGDFGKFNIVEKSYGFRLEAVSDETGHADVGTAILICLPPAVDFLKGGGSLYYEGDVTDTSEGELTKKEIKELPADLRDIYELE